MASKGMTRARPGSVGSWVGSRGKETLAALSTIFPTTRQSFSTLWQAPTSQWPTPRKLLRALVTALELAFLMASLKILGGPCPPTRLQERIGPQQISCIPPTWLKISRPRQSDTLTPMGLCGGLPAHMPTILAAAAPPVSLLPPTHLHQGHIFSTGPSNPSPNSVPPFAALLGRTLTSSLRKAEMLRCSMFSLCANHNLRIPW